MDGADDHDRADELAKKTAKLNDEQQREYQKFVNVMSDIHGPVTNKYRLDIVNTLFQGLPPRERGQQINEAGSREQQRAYWRDERARSAPTTSVKHLDSQVPALPQDGDKLQPATDAPMAGVRPNGPYRDHSKLQRTHDQVAAKQNADRAAATNSVTSLLSTEQLLSMAERYAEVRKTGKFEPTPAELRERSDMAKAHNASREKLDRAHGATPNEQQTQERVLLDHQQLAHRVGTEARLLAERLRRQGAPGAELHEREARSALHTARAVHEQRQNLGVRTDRSRDAAQVVLQQDQQRQSSAQEAARGGTPLTSEQRASASPEVKQTVDRKESAEVVRASGSDRTYEGVRQEITKSGNTRTGARSR